MILHNLLATPRFHTPNSYGLVSRGREQTTSMHFNSPHDFVMPLIMVQYHASVIRCNISCPMIASEAWARTWRMLGSSIAVSCIML